MHCQATIASTFTSVPEHVVTQEQAKDHVDKVFDLDPIRRALVFSVINNAQVHKRHLIFPLEYVIEPRPLSQITSEYKQHAVKLGREVAEGALKCAGMEPRDVDLLITVSCTGIMIPSLDAHLINDMGFRQDVKRLPITELGCAAGAAALSRAADYIRAFPEATVLVISVEIPSLTFQRHDASPAHLISCVLFGDGAAAAVVTGRPAPGARIQDSESYFFPHSLDAMGFDLRDTGFHIVLSKSVPQLIRRQIRGITMRLLARHGLSIDGLGFILFHPGGQKLLSYIEKECGLSRELTAPSWSVLSKYGNISSASVLFVMREFLDQRTPASGELGLLAAFGPGFSSEMLLLKWN